MTQTNINRYNDRIQRLLPSRCVLVSSKCVYKNDSNRRNREIDRQPFAFIARPYSTDCNDIENACREVIDMDWFLANNAVPGQAPLRNNTIATITTKNIPHFGHGYCQICALIQYSYFCVVELAHLNPNVMLEVGLMNAFSKHIIFTLDKRLTRISELPFDLSGILTIPYDSYNELKERLQTYVKLVLTSLENDELI